MENRVFSSCDRKLRADLEYGLSLQVSFFVAKAALRIDYQSNLGNWSSSSFDGPRLENCQQRETELRTSNGLAYKAIQNNHKAAARAFIAFGTFQQRQANGGCR